jgi:hypothetical protein
MLAGLERLLAWKLDLTHVDPTGLTVLTSAGGSNVRYPAGRRVVARTILGHGSTSYTTCPGSPTLRLLSTIRSAVSRIGRPKIYGGSATTSRVRPEQGGYAGVHARFTSTVRWRVAVTGSNGATVRSFAGTGSEAKVRWNGRTAGGTPAPPGWATMTVTATAGGASARPVVSRVYVDRPSLPAGSSSGGFAAGAWRVNNANAEQLSASAPVFVSYHWGRSGDLPVVGDWDGDGTQTVGVVRPNASLNSNHLLLRNSDGSVLDFWYGRHGDRILVGDWNGDGTWTPGVLRSGTRWYLKDSFTGSAAGVGLAKQTPGTPVVGDWDNRP